MIFFEHGISLSFSICLIFRLSARPKSPLLTVTACCLTVILDLNKLLPFNRIKNNLDSSVSFYVTLNIVNWTRAKEGNQKRNH